MFFFQRELPDSVIPYDMQPSFIKAHSQRKCRLCHLISYPYSLATFLLLRGSCHENVDQDQAKPRPVKLQFNSELFR